MKKNRILTSTFRKIIDTHRRFLSLLCMALLGVGFFAGIQATSPDMLKTLDAYLDENNMYDIEIISTLGLTDSDIEKIKELDNIETIEGTYTKDAIMKTDKEEYVVKMIGINDNINQIDISEGNMPDEDNQIAVEKAFLEENDLKIGDKIKLEDDKQEYEIVGVAESPLYFGIHRGTTKLGKGQIDYYMYANNIPNVDYYNSIYLTVKGSQELETNSDDYKEKVKNVIDEIDDIKGEREDNRLNEVYGDYIKLLEMQNKSIEEADLTNSKWYVYDRTNNQAYGDFIDATKGISKIGNVFPVVFYVIAILISLISMTRMVEEDRQELGTLKALGFNNFRIIQKYIIYSLLATVIRWNHRYGNRIQSITKYNMGNIQNAIYYSEL